GRAEYKGAGMGLAITKTIIEKMGGVIWAEQSNGRGTSFHLLLPAA
ncbi:MAG: signal transduction histidine kinase, partial [Psychromonas sp.]